MGYKSVALIRVSTTLQTEENGGTSIQLQKEKLNQYADLHDLELNDVIVDVASGGLETRDGVEKLKEMIERKEVDKVLIYNVSRAFRSMVHFTTFYEYLKKNNVELISVCEGSRSSRKEHQMIVDIAKNNDLKLIGINYKDTRSDGEKYLEVMGNPFNEIIFDFTGGRIGCFLVGAEQNILAR